MMRFSFCWQWEKVLDVLAHALTENNVSFSRLQPGLKHQEILQNFKVKVHYPVRYVY